MVRLLKDAARDSERFSDMRQWPISATNRKVSSEDAEASSELTRLDHDHFWPPITAVSAPSLH